MRRHFPSTSAVAVVLGLAMVPVAGRQAAAVSPQPVEAEKGMVVSAQRSPPGRRRHPESGGNAIDAAVAVGYALAVVHPCCGNIGGGGFMTIHLANGKDAVIDFRETAPAAATAGMYLDKAGKVIPGCQPARLQGRRRARHGAGPRNCALNRYGTHARASGDGAGHRARRARASCVAGPMPTILAGSAEAFAERAECRRDLPRSRARACAAGERLIQPDLAATLEAIAAGGADAFYHGRDRRSAIVAASRANGGILTVDDFAGY